MATTTTKTSSSHRFGKDDPEMLSLGEALMRECLDGQRWSDILLVRDDVFSQYDFRAYVVVGDNLRNVSRHVAEHLEVPFKEYNQTFSVQRFSSTHGNFWYPEVVTRLMGLLDPNFRHLRVIYNGTIMDGTYNDTGGKPHIKTLMEYALYV